MGKDDEFHLEHTVLLPIKLLVGTLDDDNLNKLYATVAEEKKRRLDRRIDSGSFPALSPEEIELAKKHGEIPAIKAYQMRTSISDRYVAYKLVKNIIKRL